MKLELIKSNAKDMEEKELKHLSELLSGYLEKLQPNHLGPINKKTAKQRRYVI